MTLAKIADLVDDKCYVMLKEKVIGELRGFKFTHERFLDVGVRHIDDCR